MPVAIAAPRPVEKPAPFRLPIVASLAPVVVAVVLWMVTGSPFTLLFALLGPVTALAGVADARLGARRTRRREAARFAEEERAALDAIDLAHAEERDVLAERAPTGAAIVAGAAPRTPSTLVTLGTGSVGSSLSVDPVLAERAAVLRHAPLLVDARLGIGVCAPPVLAAAMARALVVQLAHALPAGTHGITGGEPWVASLPHARAGGGARVEVRDADGVVASVATAAAESELPAGCGVVILASPTGAAVVRHPDRGMRGAVRPGVVGLEAAASWAAGLPRPAAAAVETAALGSLPGGAVGTGPHGPVVLDLVRDGPHALVAGTTGSGKSELLVSWVLAMTAAEPPERLTVLLVDFKGGSAFAPLAGLPHTVGIITDLDEAHAARALASLRAELRHRERVIADAAARSVDDVPSLARLVIVVDEFAALLADHPDLHALFSDIAARGRSLGVHLVLCTQRPAGVVRDSVLANAHLRVCLRVNNRADSVALVGTDAAAAIPARATGRGVLAPPDGEPYEVQFALAGDADVERVTRRWRGSPPPRRPWCEPLPADVDPQDAPGGFALVDLPHEQRRAVAVWSPESDGHVLVLGAARSGTSTALAALAPGGTRVPRGIAAAWDVIGAAASGGPGVLVVDDADSLLARFPPDYRQVVVERLVALLRDGPERGIHVALSAKRLTAELTPIAALAPERLLLRHAGKQDWVLAGADAASFAAGLPPGAGVWRGDRVQVVRARPPVGEADPLVADLEPGRRLAVVTTRPAEVLALLAGAVRLGDEAPGAVVVGHVDEWQSRWGALAALGDAQVVLDACTPADVRALTRTRELPPPLAGLRGVAWRLEPGGRLSRVRFDPGRGA